ncbi:hypothetical protein V6N11_026834 [Hibiscus sabdariffa]|uniref:Uncharacterized protein n=1 Tax=Hibiscus sabdariffa TaxID=183260 RepID=A0ABR2SWT8_9ROSI
MYKHAIEVSSVVSRIETRFTASSLRKLRPVIILAVGPGFPTTCKEIKQKIIVQEVSLTGSLIMACCWEIVFHFLKAYVLKVLRHCILPIPSEQLIAKNPTTMNVKPMKVPAANAAPSPNSVTPPFVPLGKRLITMTRKFQTEERKWMHRRVMKLCHTMSMSENAMKKRAVFMLVCSHCVAASVVSRLASVAWSLFVVASDQTHLVMK